MTEIESYDDDQITEAVKAVTGVDVVRTSPDDEHVFWYVVGEEDDGGVEFIDELFTPTEAEDILAYLVKEFDDA
jgi:hypothetical protein